MRVRILGIRTLTSSIRDLGSRMERDRSPSVRVERRQIPYWQERGWRREGTTYFGNYQTPYASFLGRIEWRSEKDFDFRIHKPSREIQGHLHWVCFRDVGGDWYRVHMGRRPKDLSSGIMTVERLITEAHER